MKEAKQKLKALMNEDSDENSDFEKELAKGSRNMYFLARRNFKKIQKVPVNCLSKYQFYKRLVPELDNLRKLPSYISVLWIRNDLFRIRHKVQTQILPMLFGNYLKKTYNYNQ